MTRTSRRAVWPGDRRTGMVVFVVSAAAVLVVLAVALIQVLNQQNRAAFESRSWAETRGVLAAVPDRLDRRTAEELGRTLRRPHELEVVLVDSGGAVRSSDPAIDLADVPDEIRDGTDAVSRVRTAVAGESFLVAGGSAGPGSEAVFLFFSERPLERERSRTVLVVSAGAAALLVLVATGGWLHTHRRARGLARRRAEERAYTAHMAHELRTPVGALVTAASLVDEPGLRSAPDQVRQPVEVMRAQARRLRKVVEDQLELSRLEAGQVEIRSEPVDVSQVVREVVATHAWTGVDVDLTDTAIAWAERQSLTRLVVNLLDNAVRHARDGVGIAVWPDQEAIVVEITDDGPGLAPQLASVLVGDATPGTHEERGARQAAGLGLLIARAHASLLEARISVDADGQRGTTIRIHLPAAGQDPSVGSTA